jgi:hypothetical protein
MKYEYLVLEFDNTAYNNEVLNVTGTTAATGDGAAGWLNYYGNQGWCLISRNFILENKKYIHHFVFMRPIR